MDSRQQLFLALDDVDADRKLWDACLEDIRIDCGEVGHKRVERLFERVDTKRFADGDLARMLAQHQRHELKGKHVIQLIKHMPSTRVLDRLERERGREARVVEVLTDAEENRCYRDLFKSMGDAGETLRRKALGR